MSSKNTTPILAFIIAVLAVSNAYAQKLPFVNYTTANGLTHNRVHNIAQDGDGYIWICTDLGLNRFDGREMKHFPAPGNPYLTARYYDIHNGTVYFAVDHFGVAICRGNSVKFVKADEELGYAQGMVYINDSTFLFANLEKGLGMLMGNKYRYVRTITPYAWRFLDITMDRDDNLWLACNDGLYVFPNGNMNNPVSIDFFKGTYINIIKQDAKGDIYVASRKGLHRIDATQLNDFHNITAKLLIPFHEDYTSIAFDNINNVWICNIYNGLFKYNKITGKCTNYSVANGLVSNNTWGVYSDKEDNLWVSTENGVSKLTSLNYYSFNFDNTSYPNIKSICQWDDSTMLLTNGLKLLKLVNDQPTEIKGIDDYPGFLEERLLKTPAGNLWFTSSKQYTNFGFKTKTFQYSLKGNRVSATLDLETLPDGPKEVYMNCGYVIHRDELWTITNKGLQLFKNKRFYTFKIPSLKGSNIRGCYLVKGTNGDFWLIDNFRDIVHCTLTPTPADTLPYSFKVLEYIPGKLLGKENIYKLFADSRGWIWVIGKLNNLHVLFPNKSTGKTAIYTAPPNVFSSPIFNNIAEDHQHNIWLSTAGGLDKISFDRRGIKLKKGFFNTELCGKYIFTCIPVNNKLYIGSTGCIGVASLKSSTNADVPPVYISGIKINEDPRPDLLTQSHDIILNAGDNNINFSFTGISYKDERAVTYRYKMEGLDKEWSEPSSQYSITYSLLPPGTYTFSVICRSVAGIWSTVPATFTFTILKPFYASWWFISGVVALTILLAYGFYRYRIKQIFAIQHIRQRISTDLHDDIGATVSSINILATMAKNEMIPASKREQYLDTILEESKYVSESLSDIVWSINPNNDSLEIMFARLQRYASELLEARNIAYQINLPEMQEHNISLSMNNRQHFYLIFKEAINNLAKYSKAANATIDIQLEKNRLTLRIMDDGVGFDTNTSATGNGIINMKKRAAELKADLVIESVEGNGTLIVLKTPVL